MPSTQPLFDALHDALVAAVGSSVSNRIYDTEGPEDCGLPMIVYRVERHPPDGYLAGADRLNILLSIELSAPRKAGVKAARLIHDSVFDALHRQGIGATGYHNCQAFCLDRGGQAHLRDETYVMVSAWHLFGDPD
jgi:hypothetical protein